MKIFKKSPWGFIILLGIVSLFSDITYEGARSINGQFLSLLGANATIVGLVAGLGELVGYSLRLVSGILADKFKRYWLLTFIGYSINLLAVPALALAGNWVIAAILIIIERMGKALRVPARDVMLSQASSSIGQGKGFGVHEALDQIGAITGPLFVSLVFIFSRDYHHSYSLLLIPALLALTSLTIARFFFPNPEKMETNINDNIIPSKKFYWLYILAISLVAAGFADFPLIAFHFNKTGQVLTQYIPLMYVLAMAIDAIAALILGSLFDKFGIKVLIFSTIISLLFAPLVFFGNFITAILGMICWGIGMGSQESIIRAQLAKILPKNKRGRGFGIFNAVFGASWFLGSFIMGFLYDKEITLVVIFSVLIQVLSLPIFIKIKGLKTTM